MSELRSLLDQMQLYDSCARLTAPQVANICKEILDICEPIEIANFMRGNSYLPRDPGPFVYQNVPTTSIVVYRGGLQYLIIGAVYDEPSNDSAAIYFVYILRDNGKYQFYKYYNASTVADWVRRALKECTATNTYNGLMSALMHKRLSAIYEWCVSQGMKEVK